MASDNTNVAKRPTSPVEVFKGRLENIVNTQLAGLFSDPKAASRVATAFRTAAQTSRNPDAFFECTPASIMKCIADCASTQLYPSSFNTPVWLIPKSGELYVWLNHRGIMILAERSGKRVVANPVFTSDTFELDYGNDTLKHLPGDGEQTWDTLRGVYVRVRDAKTNDVTALVWLPKAEIVKRRNKSDNKKSDGPWQAWPIEMSIKTAIKYAAARGHITFDEASTEVLERDPDNVIDVQSEPVAERPAGAAAVARARLAAPVETPPMAPVAERERVLVTPSVNDAITAALNRGVNPDDIEAVVGNREPKNIPDAEAPAIVAKLAALTGGDA